MTSYTAQSPWNKSLNTTKLDLSQTNMSMMPSGPQNIFDYKVIMLGDIAVGKTSIMNRFIDNDFKNAYHCTIGVEYKLKSLRITPSTSVNLKIWDTCGEEKFRSITRQYYREANGVCLVYDLTNKFSYEKVDSWIEDIKANNKMEELSIIIVGNKLDVQERKMYLSDEAKKYARMNKFDYIEVSAKTGKNITPLFESLAKKMVQAELHMNKQQILDNDKAQTISLDGSKANLKPVTESTGKCC